MTENVEYIWTKSVLAYFKLPAGYPEGNIKTLTLEKWVRRFAIESFGSRWGPVAVLVKTLMKIQIPYETMNKPHSTGRVSYCQFLNDPVPCS